MVTLVNGETELFSKLDWPVPTVGVRHLFQAHLAECENYLYILFYANEFSEYDFNLKLIFTTNIPANA